MNLNDPLGAFEKEINEIEDKYPEHFKNKGVRLKDSIEINLNSIPNGTNGKNFDIVDKVGLEPSILSDLMTVINNKISH
jgi:hypothetical protein